MAAEVDIGGRLFPLFLLDSEDQQEKYRPVVAVTSPVLLCLCLGGARVVRGELLSNIGNIKQLNFNSTSSLTDTTDITNMMNQLDNFYDVSRKSDKKEHNAPHPGVANS